jgi:DNA polymerase-3 subunit alpha
MIIFDTETTGFAKSLDSPLHTQPKIIELYAMKVDDETLEMTGELDLLIDPKEPISEEITKITSITDEMVKGKGAFASHAKAIASFWLGEIAACGHNITFDCDMVEIELKRLGLINKFPWTPNRVCTVELTEHYEGRRLKLIDLHTLLLGTGFESAHRARADVEATHRCLIEIKRRGDLPAFK